MKRLRLIVGLVGGALGVWGLSFNLAMSPSPAVTPAEQVEADWLRQDVVRNLPPSPRQRKSASQTVAAYQDAAGACDGVKNGKYSFHTGHEPNPWWQVDLGAAAALTPAKDLEASTGAGESRTAPFRLGLASYSLRKLPLEEALAIASTRSSQNGIAWMMPLDLVALVRCLAARRCASSKA